VIYYGWSDGAGRWLLTKGLSVNVILWEYLGSIGALDLLYVRPANREKTFRNRLKELGYGVKAR
jgi:hypothetical protein